MTQIAINVDKFLSGDIAEVASITLAYGVGFDCQILATLKDENGYRSSNLIIEFCGAFIREFGYLDLLLYPIPCLAQHFGGQCTCDAAFWICNNYPDLDSDDDQLLIVNYQVNVQQLLDLDMVAEPANDACSICIEQLNTSISIELQCGHQYHARCFEQLITASYEYCPYCRQFIDLDNLRVVIQ